jgi:hypothetical protein
MSDLAQSVGALDYFRSYIADPHRQQEVTLAASVMSSRGAAAYADAHDMRWLSSDLRRRTRRWLIAPTCSLSCRISRPLAPHRSKHNALAERGLTSSVSEEGAVGSQRPTDLGAS